MPPTEENEALDIPSPSSSNLNPTFSPTWKWPISPSTRWPRICVTSNQSSLRRVAPARLRPLRMAASMLSDEEPTISVTR